MHNLPTRWHHLLVALFIITSSLSIERAYGQENFVRGYVVTLSGDSLPGQIDYREWIGPPDFIDFREQSGSVKRYAPLDIKGFGTEDSHFRSAITDWETSPTNEKELTSVAEITLRKDTLFLQLVVEGPVSLLQYRTDIDPPQFYLQISGKIEWLKHKRFAVEKNGDRNIFENNTYRTQLEFYLTKKCVALKEAIASTKYTEKVLADLVTQYASCLTIPVQYRKKDEVKHQFRVLGGVAYSTLAFEKEAPSPSNVLIDRSWLPNSKFTSSVGPAFGLSWDVVFPKNLGRWAWHNEFLINTFSSSGHYEKIIHSNNYQIHDSELAYLRMRFGTGLRANIRLQNGSLFVILGLARNTGTFTKNTHNSEVVNFGPPTYISERLVDGPRFTQRSKFIASGIERGRVSISLRFESSSGAAGNTNALMMLGGFKLNR